VRLAALIVTAIALGSGSAAASPRFEGTAAKLDGQTRARMTGVSWHQGCPVSLSHLRLLTVSHWNFSGEVERGRLVVNADAAGAMLEAMHKLFHEHYPIRRMRLVDAYGAVDDRSMAHDNTSAFNCRFIAGQPGVWSQHAYGRAVDLNPRENPYVTASGFVSPHNGSRYADRSRRDKGLIHSGDATVRAFASVGWKWGGAWSFPKDYQHFSRTGT